MKLRELLEGTSRLEILRNYFKGNLSKKEAYAKFIKTIIGGVKMSDKGGNPPYGYGRIAAGFEAILALYKPNSKEGLNNLTNMVIRNAGINRDSDLVPIEKLKTKYIKFKWPIEYVEKITKEIRDKSTKLPKKKLSL